MKTNKLWDNEYLNQGIPSSFRNEASGVLLWCLKNCSFLDIDRNEAEVLDVGCGKGRNSVYLAEKGFIVTAFDSSSVAIDLANKLAQSTKLNHKPKFLVQDINDGLPSSENQFDLILDIFVYKHQVDFNERKSYRQNISNSLKKNGILLLSLADKDDGYYSKCIDIPNNNEGLKTITDEAVSIPSVLFNLSELIQEMSDFFRLEMVWIKTKEGKMHGQKYIRKTIATIWKPIK